MGIQINGITDTILASDGNLTVEGQSINTTGIITATSFIGANVASGGVVVSGVTTVSAGSASSPSITPTGDSNTGIFFPAADTIAFAEGGVESVRIDSSGNLGIGTNNPVAKLDVRGNMVLGYGVTTSITLLDKQFATAHISSNRGGILRVGLTDGSFSGVEIDNGVGSNPAYNSQNVHLITHNGGVAGDIRALTARFDGNVGVGTTRPFVAFEVQNSTYPHIVSNYNNSKHIRMSIGGSGGGFAITDGHFLSIAHQPFADRATDSNLTERMRIGSNGSVQIGSGAQLATERFRVTSSSTWGAAIENNNNASGDRNLYLTLGTNCNNTSSYFIDCTTATVGPKFYVYGNGTYGTVSDINLKKNIETTRDGYLEDIQKLRVVKYNWKTDTNGTPKELGWIAQELAQVFPGLVQDSQPDLDGNTVKEVKTSVLPFILLKALQEAAEQIKELQAEVAALKSQ